jgi:hypothetical protein
MGAARVPVPASRANLNKNISGTKDMTKLNILKAGNSSAPNTNQAGKRTIKPQVIPSASPAVALLLVR